MKTLSEPKDNVAIFPPDGNLHTSSYRRLGPEDEVTGISETHTMLSQIKLKDEYKPIIYPRRSLLTMQSLISAEYVCLYHKNIIGNLYNKKNLFCKNKFFIFGIKRN